MKTYTVKGFSGLWPVGTSAVVVAFDEREATMLLNQELRKAGLPGDVDCCDLKELDTTQAGVRVLCDGNY